MLFEEPTRGLRAEPDEEQDRNSGSKGSSELDTPSNFAYAVEHEVGAEAAIEHIRSHFLGGRFTSLTKEYRRRPRAGNS